jgi:hypothetical protein
MACAVAQAVEVFRGLAALLNHRRFANSIYEFNADQPKVLFSARI